MDCGHSSSNITCCHFRLSTLPNDLWGAMQTSGIFFPLSVYFVFLLLFFPIVLRWTQFFPQFSVCLKEVSVCAEYSIYATKRLPRSPHYRCSNSNSTYSVILWQEDVTQCTGKAMSAYWLFPCFHNHWIMTQILESLAGKFDFLQIFMREGNYNIGRYAHKWDWEIVLKVPVLNIPWLWLDPMWAQTPLAVWSKVHAVWLSR